MVCVDDARSISLGSDMRMITLFAILHFDGLVGLCPMSVHAVSCSGRATIFRVVGEPETAVRLLFVICAHQAFPVTVAPASYAGPWILAPPGLHAETSLDARDHVCARDVGTLTGKHLRPIGIPSRKVKEVNAREGNQEPT